MNTLYVLTRQLFDLQNSGSALTQGDRLNRLKIQRQHARSATQFTPGEGEDDITSHKRSVSQPGRQSHSKSAHASTSPHKTSKYLAASTDPASNSVKRSLRSNSSRTSSNATSSSTTAYISSSAIKTWVISWILSLPWWSVSMFSCVQIELVVCRHVFLCYSRVTRGMAYAIELPRTF